MATKAALDLETDVDAVNMNGTTPGGTYTVLGAADGYDLYAAASFLAQIVITQTPAGTSPTLDVRIQHSADREHWATLADFTQIVKTGTYPQSYVYAVPTATIQAFGRYGRLQYKVGGSESPEWTVTGKIMPKE